MCTHLRVEAGGQPQVSFIMRPGLSLAWSLPVQLGWQPWSPRGSIHFGLPSTEIASICHYHCAQLSVKILRLELLSLMWQTRGWLSCLHTPGFFILQGLVPAFVLLVLMNASSSLQIQTEVTHLRPFLVISWRFVFIGIILPLVIISYVSFYY